MRLSKEVLEFFKHQDYVIVSTIDAKGIPHSALKGIVRIMPGGRIELLDLFTGKTFSNLAKNNAISVTAADEHRFKGYCLKGRARITGRRQLSKLTISLWNKKITKRISQRLIKNIKGQRGHDKHPEAMLPEPKYLISVLVEEIVDLTPHFIK